jgi:hypothetical protein
VPIQRNEDDPLLDEIEARREDAPVNVITVPQLLTARGLRKPLAIICLAMASQQLSGKSPWSHLSYTYSAAASLNQASTQVSCLLDSNVLRLIPLPVLYYSNNILSKSLPDLGPYVSLGVTVVNVLMTFPPIVLIEVSLALEPLGKN